MKKIIFLLLFASSLWQQASAQDFTSGDLIYSINSGTTVQVASQNGAATGAITIPSQVTYNSTSYAVTSIGYGAFEGCSGLTSITIPNSVISIEDWAFGGCTGLTSLICNSTAPLGIDGSVFAEVTQQGVYLVVPAGSVVAYQAADVWQNFGAIVSNPTFSSPTTISACSNYTWLVNNQTYLNSGTYYYTSTSNGIDYSLETLVLTLESDSGDGINYNGITYIITSPTTVAVGSNPNANDIVVIPATITTDCGTYAVTSIGYEAFYGCSGLTSITIPNSVISIEDWAFAGCIGLTSVTCNIAAPLPINSTIFDNVNQSTCSLAVPAASVAAYQAAGVWQDFSPITSSTVINTTTVAACGSYTWINNNVTYTESGVYYGTTTGGVTEQLNLTIINPAATNFSFNGINYVITSPTTVAVGINANATGGIVIPAAVTTACGTYEVTSINNNAFKNRSGLTSVIFPNSLTSIGTNAFEGCGLTSVTMPNSVTSIGDFAFYNCSALLSVTILTPTIPASVTSIGKDAFNNCTSLISVTIPNTVTSIGARAFRLCTSLTSITIPNGITIINSGVFSRCYSLTSATIPDSVTSIANYAFSRCSSLTSVTIPALVQSIGNYAFQYCYNLNAVICNIITPLTINPNVFLNVNQGVCSLTVPEASITAYQVKNVWKNFYIVGAIVINTTTIFACTSYTWANNNTTYTASGIYTGTTTNGVTEQLNLTITGNAGPGSNFSFEGLNYVVTSPTTAALGVNEGAAGDVVIPATVTTTCYTYAITGIGDYAFAYCSDLTSVTIPDSVTSIGASAFSQCFGLTSVTIPNAVTSIGDAAFFACHGLTAITIPALVSSIGDYAFADCYNLSSVICNIVTPLSIDPTVFEGVNQAACGLTVPNGSYTAYTVAPVWEDFYSINDLLNPTFSTLSLQLYPVPAKTILNIQSSNNMVPNKITIIDLTGKIVLTQTTNTNQVEIARLSSGMYIIQALSGDTKFVGKFVKD